MSDFTYPEVGATLTDARLPSGYRRLRHRTRIGRGQQVFATAGNAVLTWRMHRALGVRMTASADRAAPGVRVTIGLGSRRFGLTAPCAVVWVREEPTRLGFAYGTLAAHPECGEESFLVELAEDGTVWFTVTAFSRAARWYTRTAGPLVPLFQWLYARRCGQVLRRAAAGASRATPSRRGSRERSA